MKNDNILYTLRDKSTGLYYYDQHMIRKANTWVNDTVPRAIVKGRSDLELIEIELKIKVI